MPHFTATLPTIFDISQKQIIDLPTNRCYWQICGESLSTNPTPPINANLIFWGLNWFVNNWKVDDRLDAVRGILGCWNRSINGKLETQARNWFVSRLNFFSFSHLIKFFIKNLFRGFHSNFIIYDRASHKNRFSFCVLCLRDFLLFLSCAAALNWSVKSCGFFCVMIKKIKKKISVHESRNDN